MKELTKKQRKILLYIKKFTAENGYQPTREQMGKQTGITGTAVTHQVRLMEQKGAIKRIGRIAIKILVKI